MFKVGFPVFAIFQDELEWEENRSELSFYSQNRN